jgi:hypothetical protein
VIYDLSSYSGGRNQDGGSKPAWADDSATPHLEKPNTKKGCGVAQDVGPEFKPQYHKKKKKKG